MIKIVRHVKHQAVGGAWTAVNTHLKMKSTYPRPQKSRELHFVSPSKEPSKPLAASQRGSSCSAALSRVDHFRSAVIADSTHASKILIDCRQKTRPPRCARSNLRSPAAEAGDSLGHLLNKDIPERMSTIGS